MRRAAPGRRILLLAALLAGCGSGSVGPVADLGGPGPDAPVPVADGGGDQPAVDQPSADLPPATCGTPRPFVPPGQPTGWRHTTTSLLVVTQGPANHRGQDVMVTPGAPQVLIGKFAYGAFDKDLKDEEVEVFIQRQPPCGDWISLGSALTSEEGQHGTQYGIEDDGGRIFFTIPSAQQRGIGRHPVRMLVKGDHSLAAFNLLVVPPGTGTVVFDIDGTITTDDFQLVSELFSKLLEGSYDPQMYAGAPDVARAWADKGYLLLYLTGRPDQLRQMTQSWLVSKGLPPGAVHLTDTTAQAMPTSSGVGAYKSAVLTGLTTAAKVELVAAYGNATTDIEAYAAAAIPKARTYIIGPNAGQQGTVAVPSYTAHLSTAAAGPPAAVAAPPAWGWW